MRALHHVQDGKAIMCSICYQNGGQTSTIQCI